MNTSSITQKMYLKVAQSFHWATRDHYVMWFTGSTQRHHRTEAILPRLVKRKALHMVTHGKMNVYTCPRKARKSNSLQFVDHGLGVTECMVRLWRSNMDAVLLEERLFRKCNCIPDVGVRYPSKKLILVEYTSNDNFSKYNNLKNKLASYKKNLWKIEDRFSCSGIILFVINVSREEMEKFVFEVMPIGLPVFFVDFKSFRDVPIGNQLSAPIYIWGEDGKTYPLTEDAQL